MIIFDLDGTLADCEHRRHFVDKSLDGCNHWYKIPNHPIDLCDACKIRWKSWKPNWKAFYESCDKDEPIECVIEMWNSQISLGAMGQNEIWSGRCESVREKTEKWLNEHLLCFDSNQLKMRPIGNYTPDDELKEGWLHDAIVLEGKKIDCVFDDRPKVIRMWRRHGIFVFNCCQHDEEF